MPIQIVYIYIIKLKKKIFFWISPYRILNIFILVHITLFHVSYSQRIDTNKLHDYKKIKL